MCMDEWEIRHNGIHVKKKSIRIRQLKQMTKRNNKAPKGGGRGWVDT